MSQGRKLAYYMVNIDKYWHVLTSTDKYWQVLTSTDMWMSI